MCRKKQNYKTVTAADLGISEAELVEVIDKVVSLLASKFKFGYHDLDDMKQSGRLFALEALPRYDKSQKLDGFLYIHVRNQYINYQRDNYYRSKPPCSTCPFNDPQLLKSNSGCSVFVNKFDCDKYLNWNSRNDTKKGLMNLKTIDHVSEDHLGETLTDHEKKEILDIIDQKLCPEDRRLFLMLKDKVSIPTAQRRKLIETIKEILGEHNLA